MRPQQTIANPVTLEGIGLHTGNPSVMTFRPAGPGTGRVIVRTDLPGQPEIHPSPERVSQTVRGTTIRENGVEVHTVEHVLAALAGLDIDNCRIELTSNEPPIMDGSAQMFVEALLRAGIAPQSEPVDPYVLDHVVTLEQDGKTIVAWPYDGLRLTYCLEYDQPWPKSQRVELEITPDTFRARVAAARTYGFEHEIAWLRGQGLARGGSPDNAIILTAEGTANGPFRFEDELACHKLLDMIGDLALLGFPVRGHFVAHRSGHAMNACLAERLLKKKTRESAQRRRESVIINAKEIQELLPHRYPILLVDRVIDLEEGKRVVGIKNVTMNEQFFQGHFPGHPIMPGVLIVEAMAQCGGVLLLKNVPDAKSKVVYFTNIDNVKFRKPVLPGDQLRFELTVEKVRSRMAKMHGNAFVGEDLVCEADLTSMIMDR